MAKFKLGDKVRILASGWKPQKVGDVITVVADDTNEANFIRDGKGEISAVNRHAHEFELVESAPLKIGDTVRVIGSQWAPEGEDNTVVVVVEDGSIPTFYINNGQIEQSFAQYHLTKGNVAFVEAAQTLKQEEDESESEPAPLVLGDVIRVTTDQWGSTAPKGSLAIVVEDDTNVDNYVRDGKAEIGYVTHYLGRFAEKVDTSRGIKGATYEVVAHNGRIRHHVAVGDQAVCVNEQSDRIPGFSCTVDGDAAYQYIPIEDLKLVALPSQVVETADVTEPKCIEPKVATPFKVGDKVELIFEGKNDDDEPYYGWGKVRTGAVGIVAEVNEEHLLVDFTSHKQWMAKAEELALVTSTQPVVETVRAERAEAPVYVVVHESRQEDFLKITADREEARGFKASKGGKRAGYIINQYVKAKEIR